HRLLMNGSRSSRTLKDWAGVRGTFNNLGFMATGKGTTFSRVCVLCGSLLPLEGKVFGAAGGAVLEVMRHARGQEHEVAAFRGDIAVGDMHADIAASYQEYLFRAVHMLGVADLAGVEGGGVHVDVLQPGGRLAEDGSAFAFGGGFHGELGPACEERSCFAGFWTRTGFESEKIETGDGFRCIADDGFVCCGKEADAAGAQGFG